MSASDAGHDGLLEPVFQRLRILLGEDALAVAGRFARDDDPRA